MNEEEKQEFIHEASDEVQESQEPPKMPTILEMLQYELREHMKVSLDYKKKIDEAKTDPKKEYYKKKLKKNNVQALQILTAIERYTQQKSVVHENKQEEKDEPTDEVSE